MITKGEIKNYLWKANEFSKSVRQLQEKIATLRSQAMKQTSAWSDTPRGGKLISSPQEQAVEKIYEFQQLLEKKSIELIVQERLAWDLIDLLPDGRHKRVLIAYHINRLNLYQIAQQENYSERQIKRDKENAYYRLADIVNKNPAIEAKIRKGLEQ